MIIRTRRRWIAVAKALRDEGVLPPGVDDPEIYRQRSGEVILPRSVDWWDGSAPCARSTRCPRRRLPRPRVAGRRNNQPGLASGECPRLFFRSSESTFNMVVSHFS